VYRTGVSDETLFSIEVITAEVTLVSLLFVVLSYVVVLKSSDSLRLLEKSKTDKQNEKCGDHICLADTVPYEFSKKEVRRCNR